MTARWQGHSHEELYTMINGGPGPRASDPQTAYWAGLTKELADVDKELNDALSKLRVSWEGDAAETANQSSTPLQQWAGDAQTGSTVMQVSAEDQANFISTARAEMPKPVEVTTPEPSTWQVIGAGAMAGLGNPGPAAAVAAQAADHEAQEQARDAAAQKAVDTMETYQSNSTWNSNTLGTFVPPPDIQVATTTPESSNSASGRIGGWMSSGTYSGPSGGTQTSSITTAPNTGTGGNTGGRPLPPSPPGSGAPNVGGGSNPLLPGNTTPSTVAPAPPATGFNPDPTTLPPGGGGGNPPYERAPLPGGGQGPLPTTSLLGGLSDDDPALRGRNTQPGLRGTPGPGGLGGPESGSGARPGTGGLGGSGGLGAESGRPGAQLARGLGAAPGEGALGGGRGGVGAGGAGARGGGLGATPMGGGGSAGGDEDEERYSPDYLLETTGVFDDDRMVSPAVIGEDPKIEES